MVCVLVCDFLEMVLPRLDSYYNGWQWGFLAFHEHVFGFFSFWLLQNYVVSYCLFIKPSAVAVLHHCDVLLLMDFRFDTISAIWLFCQAVFLFLDGEIVVEKICFEGFYFLNVMDTYRISVLRYFGILVLIWEALVCLVYSLRWRGNSGEVLCHLPDTGLLQEVQEAQRARSCGKALMGEAEHHHGSTGE